MYFIMQNSRSLKEAMIICKSDNNNKTKFIYKTNTRQ